MQRLILLGAALLTGCGPSADDVQAAINDANYCNVASDCVAVNAGCPFGCATFVNANEKKRIEKLVAEFREHSQEQCMYDCMAVGPVECRDAVCVAPSR